MILLKKPYIIRFDTLNIEYSEEKMQRLIEAMNGEDNDLLLFVSDTKYMVVCDALAALRNHLGKELTLYDSKELGLLWVVDFPIF